MQIGVTCNISSVIPLPLLLLLSFSSSPPHLVSEHDHVLCVAIFPQVIFFPEAETADLSQTIGTDNGVHSACCSCPVQLL